MNQREKRLAALAAIFAIVMVAATCVGIWIPGIEIVFYLAVGWILFLYRVLPGVHVRWDLVASTAAYAAAFLVGSHLFLRWLCGELGSPAARWRWRWTIGGFALVLLTFAAGISMVGIVHQAAWLITSPKPLYHTSHSAANRVKCASNLRQIGQALQMYASDNAGKLPDDLTILAVKEELPAALFTCPSSSDVPEGNTRDEEAANLKKPGHCSYLYFGRGLSMPVADNRVLAVEPLENHEDQGMNVLYGDGHVDWVLAPQAQELFDSLTRAAARPATAPSTQP